MTFVMPKYLRVLKYEYRLPKFRSMASLFHRQSLWLALFLALLPSTLFGSNMGEDGQLTYRTGTSEVRVTFFATDQNGRPIETITKDDFAVVDSGIVVRNFRGLSRSNETSLDVVAVVDTSESVAPRFRANMHHVVQLVDTEAGIANHSVSVIQFAGMQPALVCSGNCNSSAALQNIQAVKAEGATPLFDALNYTAQFISARRSPDVRQVIILFSDGNDTISRVSAGEAFGAVVATGALLYTVNLGSSDSPGSLVLRQLAEATGGRWFSARDGVENVLQAILADLRAAYVVTYALPSREPGFHSLRILPKNNLNLRFHCRRGYSYEESH